MPLLEGKKNQGKNIAELMHSGKPKDTAIAISYSVLERIKKPTSKRKTDAN